MVVILLLTPYHANGCDEGSEESSTLSTTSTGATAIPSASYRKIYQKDHQHHPDYATVPSAPSIPNVIPDHFTSNRPSHIPSHNSNDTSQRYVSQLPAQQQNHNSHRLYHRSLQYHDSEKLQKTSDQYFKCPTIARNRSHQNISGQNHSIPTGSFKPYQNPSLSPAPSPPPPKTPKKPPFEFMHANERSKPIYRFNAIPKPPRGGKQIFKDQRIRIPQNGHYIGPEAVPHLAEQHRKEATPYTAIRSSSGNRPRKGSNKENALNRLHNGDQKRKELDYPSPTLSKITNTSDIVRHVTRVNFYDIDTFQVEFESKDEDESETEAITKEEEWITKKKTELTTTRQIETRVKRQVVLADGKVVEDSGPIVSTNTTEDTDKQETESTEKRDNQPNVASLIKQDTIDGGSTSPTRQIPLDSNAITTLVPRPADGLVRETNEQRVITHEEIKDYRETEDVQHLGDFSDETYIDVVNSNTDNITEALLSAAKKDNLLTTSPTKVIANENKSFKTIDTEDILQRCFAQSDGTLITEKENTTKHEVIIDEDLPENIDPSQDSVNEKLKTVEARQHFFKQRDEQNIDLIANGKVVDTEMRYIAETMQLERDGSLERPGDWDSLSDRLRKLRRPQKSILQQQKAALILDRKDALTKRPLDFDREEETRKGETMKWLESHFGSESTASNDSRDDNEIEPTRRTFFNVTIKSNHGHNDPKDSTGQKLTGQNSSEHDYHQERDGMLTANAKTKFHHGGAERKNPTSHFATKAFQDDLRETVERNRLRRGPSTNSGENLFNGNQKVAEPKDPYVSREDILLLKRQSLSSQFLARTKRGSGDIGVPKKCSDYTTSSHTDIRIGLNENEKRFSAEDTYVKKISDLTDSKTDCNFSRGHKTELEIRRPQKQPFRESEAFENLTPPRDIYGTQKSWRETKTPINNPIQTQSMERPTVPARKRIVEKRLRQLVRTPSESATAFEHLERVEPPPDYSPPPRSRSASPQIDYILSSKDEYTSAIDSLNFPRNPVSARKLNQRTRFAPSALPQHSPQAQTSIRPKMSTQTTQTTPSTISSSTAASHKSNKMGQVIGNSIRKLVNKIRSASAERKFRMKTKSKSRDHSPATQGIDKIDSNSQSTTYQQYNVIDSHIRAPSNDFESEHDYSKQHQIFINNQTSVQIPTNSQTHHDPEQHSFNQSHRKEAVSLMPVVKSGEKVKTLRRQESCDLYADQRDLEAGIGNPRQRYYLGEDPYSSTLYGKENMYNSGTGGRQNREIHTDYMHRNSRANEARHENRSKEPERFSSSNTLGRYQKSSQRLVGSTPNLTQNHRTAKTLPRKLADHPEFPAQRDYGSEMEDWENGHTTTAITINAGPAKPARTFTKSLNRSKSFNLHGINGGSENNPVHPTKQRNYQNLQLNIGQKISAYGTEDAHLQSGLKSPSIVNLISRSQKDLTKIGSIENEREYPREGGAGGVAGGSGIVRFPHNETNEKKIIFLKNSHPQTSDPHRTLHSNEDYRQRDARRYPVKVAHAMDSKSAIQINKDTAGIIRGGSYGVERKPVGLSSKERIHQYHMDGNQRRASGSTIIAINRK